MLQESTRPLDPLVTPHVNPKPYREVEALQEFYKMLSEDPARAFYGPGHVYAAAELGAIQVGAGGEEAAMAEEGRPQCPTLVFALISLRFTCTAVNAVTLGVAPFRPPPPLIPSPLSL